jgi:hypothetical protein
MLFYMEVGRLVVCPWEVLSQRLSCLGPLLYNMFGPSMVRASPQAVGRATSYCLPVPGGTLRQI